MGGFIDTVRDPVFLLSLFVSVAIFLTVISVAVPMLQPDKLQNRMKAVAVERDKIRARERARLQAESARGSLRSKESKRYMRDLVEKLSLKKALADEKTEQMLLQAGYRGEAPLTIFLFARFVLPFVFIAVAAFYVYVVLALDRPPIFKVGICLGVGFFGFYLPILYVRNATQKRQTSIKRAFPDALDLLLICVESGMSIETAMRKVAEEIVMQSVELAEEFSLTMAELSFLPDRKTAYENLANRVGLDGVKSVCLALIQSERYGTPLGTTLRVMAQENRDMRMNEAEKKAAALPPKLTVPMIVFFLPVLFAVIMAPAIIKIMSL
ncbi:type II secretion system F family protein [Chthonobacter rhizosphaerae]|uniref:type II secretion system F family protein n=1 Tax=Chthonobacter rhizosphaerae TaxID=2735553 RepID=UPI0015EFD4D0|nr:type II secretion system F family protein [Chthonobacter rhizosphaerae]